jgi:hypothetical protein
MCFAEGFVAADAAGLLALWTHVPVDEGVLLPAAVLPKLLLLFNLLQHDMCSFCHSLSYG